MSSMVILRSDAEEENGEAESAASPTPSRQEAAAEPESPYPPALWEATPTRLAAAASNDLQRQGHGCCSTLT